MTSTDGSIVYYCLQQILIVATIIDMHVLLDECSDKPASSKFAVNFIVY